jgi:hypothetical protein
MPFGTAAGRLRKMVMLDLLQRLGEDRCFRCGELITDPIELSIDHRRDWQGRDPALFWDLRNIAFSHRVCNRPNLARDQPFRGGNPRKVGPDGTAWCWGHQDFLPIAAFWPRPERWNGVRDRCKVCEMASRPSKPPRVRRCRWCGTSQNLLARRLACEDCWRSHQRETMRQRRGNTQPSGAG